MFFPAPSEPADAAVALCRTCDVQGACLAWALEVGDCHGVWGGTTPRERRAMLVAWRSDEFAGRGERSTDAGRTCRCAGAARRRLGDPLGAAVVAGTA